MAYGGYAVGYPPAQVSVTRSTTWAVAPPPPINVASTRATSWVVRSSRVANRSTTWTVYSTTTTTTFVPSVRLKAYAPNGAVIGRLPTPNSPTMTYPLNDVGALSFSYAMASPNAALLGAPVEISVEISPDNGQTWVEPPDSRFLYLTDGRDPIARDDKINADCKGYVWRLTKARVLPGPAPLTDPDRNLTDADGKRPFVNATPGAILTTLFTEATTRGALAGMTFASFSASSDSSGAAWSRVMTIGYEPGLDYLAVIMDLADQGIVDFRMVGRDLRVFNADTVMATDRTLGSSPIILRSGKDLTEAPFRRTWEGLADYAYFAGAGSDTEYTDPLAITPWGRQETFISNGNVNDPGTMLLLAQQQLSLTEQERIEYTHGLTFLRAQFRPFWEYGVGDFVWSVIKGSTPIKLRIRQLTLSVTDLGQLTGNVVLNDRFLEADVRAQRQINGITNGSSAGTGTGTPKETNEPVGSVAPAKVTGLTASSAAYMGPGGFPQAQVSLSWNPVTLDPQGAPVTVDRYEVYQRTSFSALTARRIIQSSPDTSITLSPYQCGSIWDFSIRAVRSTGARGAFSDEIEITMALDTVPPQAPTTPTVTSRLGTLVAKWDGKPITGSWPQDFDHIEVHTSLVNNFTPDATTLFDQLYGVGTTVITGTFGVPIFVKFVAVDRGGLKSVPSAQGTGTPSRLVGSDIDPDAITYEQIGFKDPGNVILDGSFETSTFRAAVLAQSSSSWGFTSADATHGSWSAIINAASGTGSRQLVLMDAFDRQQIKATEKLFCRMAYKGTAGATGVLQLVVEWTLANATTVTTPIIGLVKTGVWQQIAAQATAPTNVVSFRIYVEVDAAGTTGTYTVDALEVRRTVGTIIIEDAAIGNAQIANLAVNSAKIADLQVGKLTGGSLTADVLVAGRIQTATAGNRLELSGTGLRLYDNGTVTGHWDPLLGKLMIFSTGDASHVSDNHGMQFGQSTGQNLIIDENEIMSRFNGDYASLLLNREGGRVLIGGIKGGFALDGSDAGQIPGDDNHVVSIRASLFINNVTDGEAEDNYSPLVVGTYGSKHTWMDSNEIGAADGNHPAQLFINGPSNGPVHHYSSTVIGSNSLAFRRGGSFSGGDRIGFIYGYDGATDCGIRFDGAGNTISAKHSDNTGFVPMLASAFTVSSQASTKERRGKIPDALGLVRAAKAERWQYRDHIEPDDRWHYGPMLEDLPAELHYELGKVGEGEHSEKVVGYDVVSLVGVLWDAVSQLTSKIEKLEKGGK